MGANGTFSKGIDIPKAERGYRTVYQMTDNIVVIEHLGKTVKMPEESHTPGRIYVTFKSDGSDVKGIAQYATIIKRYGRFIQMITTD